MRLICDGVDQAPVETASTFLQKLKGLLGRKGLEGALFFKDVSSVHTFFMRFPIDAAFLDADLKVRSVQRLAPYRLSKHAENTCHVLEAEAGAFSKWSLQEGSQLEIRR